MFETFEYYGLANIDDFHSDVWKNLYNELNAFQKEFLSYEKNFRSKEYIWPSDALNGWSRIWEYPFTVHNVLKIKNSDPQKKLKILEFGSGVTFLPFYLAKKGFEVVATDIDKVCEIDIPRVLKYMDVSPGTVNFKLSEPQKINVENESIDIIVSVSVIEHVENYNKLVEEFYRVLKPGGFIVATCDVDLGGEYELKPDNYNLLMSLLEENFEPIFKKRVIHPLKNLTTKTSILPYPSYKNISQKVFKIIIRKIKDIFGIKYFKPPYIAIQSLVLKKK